MATVLKNVDASRAAMTWVGSFVGPPRYGHPRRPISRDGVARVPARAPLHGCTNDATTHHVGKPLKSTGRHTRGPVRGAS